jgi:hypothetical protein
MAGWNLPERLFLQPIIVLSTYWLNLGWVLMSWVSHRLRDQDNCCIHLSGSQRMDAAVVLWCLHSMAISFYWPPIEGRHRTSISEGNFNAMGSLCLSAAIKRLRAAERQREPDNHSAQRLQSVQSSYSLLETRKMLSIIILYLDTAFFLSLPSGRH